MTTFHIIVYIVLPVFFIVSIAVTGRLEKRLVWQYGDLNSTALPDVSGYAEQWTNQALQCGFILWAGTGIGGHQLGAVGGRNEAGPSESGRNRVCPTDPGIGGNVDESVAITRIGGGQFGAVAGHGHRGPIIDGGARGVPDSRRSCHAEWAALVTRITSDVDAMNEMFTAGVLAIVDDFFNLAIMAGVMLAINWWLALLAFSVLPLILVVTRLFRDHVRASFRRVRAAIGRINSFTQEHISGMSVVQLFNREQRAFDDFEDVNRQHMIAFKDTIFAYALYYPAVELLSAIAIALVIWRGGFGVLSGGVTVGVLAMFIQYSQRFWRPIQDLSDKYNILQSAMAASERIFKLLDTEPEIVSPAAPLKGDGSNRIEFRHVWFTYQKLTPEQQAAVADFIQDNSRSRDRRERLAAGHPRPGRIELRRPGRRRPSASDRAGREGAVLLGWVQLVLVSGRLARSRLVLVRLRLEQRLRLGRWVVVVAHHHHHHHHEAMGGQRPGHNWKPMRGAPTHHFMPMTGAPTHRFMPVTGGPTHRFMPVTGGPGEHWTPMTGGHMPTVGGMGGHGPVGGGAVWTSRH